MSAMLELLCRVMRSRALTEARVAWNWFVALGKSIAELACTCDSCRRQTWTCEQVEPHIPSLCDHLSILYGSINIVSITAARCAWP